MPKGVEHFLFDLVVGVWERVPNSVMPKGVEHRSPASGSGRITRVPNSVMPKGVEHHSLPTTAYIPCGCRIQ